LLGYYVKLPNRAVRFCWRT